MNYFLLLKKQARERGDAPFLHCEGRFFSYGEIFSRVLDEAAAFERNHAPLTAVFLPTPLEQLTAFLALQALDRVPLILHPQTPQAEVSLLAAEKGIGAVVGKTGAHRTNCPSPEIPNGACMGFRLRAPPVFPRFSGGVTKAGRIFSRSRTKFLPCPRRVGC